MNTKTLHSLSVYLTLVLLFLVSSPVQTIAQDYSKPIDYIKNFSSMQDKLPRENIFIHTDRDLYYEGDRVWFSAYVVTGGYNFLSEVSKILHVELVGPSGKSIKNFSVELENGRADGNLHLKDLPSNSGTYQLKAYTLWSLNFGAHNKFIKNINIVSGKKASSGNGLEQITDVQFFPEGGPLLVDIPTRIGIKAIDENGLGKFVSGSIYNNEGSKITNFKTEHLGMGVTEFTPTSGTSYYAMVDGNRYDLPQVENGVSVSVDQTEELFNLEITRSNSVEKDFLLFTHVRGKVYNASPLQIKNQSTKLSISKKDLATGVVHFTLLNSDAQPVSERLAFNKNSVDQLDVSLSIDKDDLKLRTRAEMNIQVIDQQGDPKLAAASVSVFDEILNNYRDDDTSIESYLYLESDIAGYIEKPGYYFSDASNANEHLDLLLLTQGWKSFNSRSKVQTEQLVIDYLPQEGFTISGEILRPWTSKPLENAVIALSIGNDFENLQILTTDEEGRFYSLPMMFEGEQLVSVRANRNNGKDNVKIRIDNLESELTKTKIDAEYKNAVPFGKKVPVNSVFINSDERATTAQEYTELLQDVQMTMEMDEITVKAKRRVQSLLMHDYSNQALADIKTIDNDILEAYKDLDLVTALDQILGSRMNQFKSIPSYPNRRYTNNTYSISGGSGNPFQLSNFDLYSSEDIIPVIILNGIYVSYSELYRYKTNEIERIGYSQGEDINFPLARSLVIKTKTDNAFISGYKTKFVKGVQTQTTFYAPKYGVTIDPNSEQLDQRITLHWDPMLDIIDGENTSSFWTNDIPSTYRVVVQGLTHDGIPFVTTKTFEVSK